MLAPCLHVPCTAHCYKHDRGQCSENATLDTLQGEEGPRFRFRCTEFFFLSRRMMFKYHNSMAQVPQRCGGAEPLHPLHAGIPRPERKKSAEGQTTQIDTSESID